MKRIIIGSLIASTIIISGAVKQEKEGWNCGLWNNYISSKIQSIPYVKKMREQSLNTLYKDYLRHLNEKDFDFAEIYQRAILEKLYGNSPDYDSTIKALKILCPRWT